MNKLIYQDIWLLLLQSFCFLKIEESEREIRKGNFSKKSTYIRVVKVIKLGHLLFKFAVCHNL